LLEALCELVKKLAWNKLSSGKTQGHIHKRKPIPLKSSKKQQAVKKIEQCAFSLFFQSTKWTVLHKKFRVKQIQKDKIAILPLMIY